VYVSVCRWCMCSSFSGGKWVTWELWTSSTTAQAFISAGDAWYEIHTQKKSIKKIKKNQVTCVISAGDAWYGYIYRKSLHTHTHTRTHAHTHTHTHTNTHTHTLVLYLLGMPGMDLYIESHYTHTHTHTNTHTHTHTYKYTHTRTVANVLLTQAWVPSLCTCCVANVLLTCC
jgi:hypothetical protein